MYGTLTNQCISYCSDYSKLIRLTNVTRSNDKVFPGRERTLPFPLLMLSAFRNTHLYPKGQSTIRKGLVKDDRQHFFVFWLYRHSIIFFIYLFYSIAILGQKGNKPLIIKHEIIHTSFPVFILFCFYTIKQCGYFVFTSYSYTAVAMPMLYNTRYSSRRRVTVMISVVWVLSFAISCPVLFGQNNTGKKE